VREGQMKGERNTTLRTEFSARAEIISSALELRSKRTIPGLATVDIRVSDAN